MDTIGAIIAFENGELSGCETLELFAELIKTGAAWTLQGSYGRTAAALIERGLITPRGNVVGDLNVLPAQPGLDTGQEV